MSEEKTICEDCGLVWIVECNNEDVNLCLYNEKIKEIKKPSFLLTVLREETDPLGKLASLNSPARLTCIVICPEDKNAYKWKVNHKGKGSAAYSGCMLDPALQRCDLKRKHSKTTSYSDESITTFKPLNCKRKKIRNDENDISGDMRTENSDINSDVRKESSRMNIGVWTDDVINTENTMYIENSYEHIKSDIDDIDNRNIDCEVKFEIKEESLMDETQDLSEATDQFMERLDTSTSLPEPFNKESMCLESQEGILQHTNMGSTQMVPLLNFLGTMVQARTGQGMQVAGQGAQTVQAKSGQRTQAAGLSAQTVQVQSGQELQAARLSAQMVQVQSGQELKATKLSAQMVQMHTGIELQAARLSAQMVLVQSGQRLHSAGQSEQMVQLQSGQELQATEMSAQMVQLQSGQELQATGQNAQHKQTYQCKICQIVFYEAYLYDKHKKEQNYLTCAFCIKYYKTKPALIQHIRYDHYKNMSEDEKAEAIKQTGVLDFTRNRKIMCLNDSCIENGKYFSTLNNLREHMQLIHNEDHPLIAHTFDTFEVNKRKPTSKEVRKRYYEKKSSDPEFKSKDNKKRQERRLKFINSLTDEENKQRKERERIRVANSRVNRKKVLSKVQNEKEMLNKL